jgi:hypothetical protein
MHATATWRELLGAIISDPREKQRLSNELNVLSSTLMDWVQGSTQPDTEQFQDLLNALPQHRQALLPLIAQEIEHTAFSNETGEAIDEESSPLCDNMPGEIVDIPSIFYAQILRGYASTPHSLHSWFLTNTVLYQALIQLDPRRLGLVLTLIRCMPPMQDGKVRSLRECHSMGTPPWGRNQERDAIMLGAESLAGYAVTSNHPIIFDQLEEERSVSVPQIEYAISTAAYPIQRAGMIAGCLLISSTQSRYFTPTRLTLVHRYADLLAISFATDEFYDAECFELATMPDPAIQRERLATFRQRVARLMSDSLQEMQDLDTYQVELQIWQEFEQEFLSL